MAYPVGAPALAGLAACATFVPGLFGPPAVEVEEAHAGGRRGDLRPLELRLAAGEPPEIEWIPYDWSLNDAEDRSER